MREPVYYPPAALASGRPYYEDMTLVANRTALRLPQDIIDRLRNLARFRSQVEVMDVAWTMIGRDLLERALADEEHRVVHVSQSQA
jgi:hypothetical protein